MADGSKNALLLYSMCVLWGHAENPWMHQLALVGSIPSNQRCKTCLLEFAIALLNHSCPCMHVPVGGQHALIPARGKYLSINIQQRTAHLESG